ncbi:hypothetical protein KZ829_19230 [Actinoplanes hulinensis]|uniref:Anti-sigma factor n=1 Tax=Actinoplanes hulinensis TaxID=1144547 RepID=A0ABS7B4P2_9ACTN|nr:hypothetical protein [Actinoplanes hulinensis]MBW6435877.1 hypothetical protein [Actinoplanes hulinensis]
MPHPSDGLLRRLVDEPDGVADSDREHVTSCGQCRSRLVETEAEALLVESALRFDVEPDVDAAWNRLVTGEPVAAPVRHRRRFAVRSPFVAVVGVVALLGGASAAAAGDWFQIFRTEHIAPVTVEQADLVALPDLSDYGVMTVTERPNVRNIEGAGEARRITGLPTPLVKELPRGVTGQPRFVVGDQIKGIFTFDQDKAEAALGQPLPEPPAGLETSQFSLTAGPGLAAVWSEARGVPALIVGRVKAPAAYSTGVPFETGLDYLLTLPGLPATVADQLRSFKNATTLPLLVRSATQVSFTTDVNGTPATVLASRDGAVSTVVWVEKGHVNAVGGTLSTDEVLDVARNLRWKQ